jgi:hypothetical protein
MGTGTQVVVPLPLAGTYTVFAESYSCAASASRAAISVTALPLPIISISTPSPIVCLGQTTTLTVSGANTYTWIAGASGNSTMQVVTPATTTSYSVQGSSQGCPGSAGAIIIVEAAPVLTLTSSKAVVCAGTAVTLTALGATAYTWTGAGSGNSSTLQVKPTTTADYSITGNSGSICEGHASISVSVSPCTGIEDLSGLDLAVYPNPNQGEFIVESSHQTDFIIFNSLGQAVMHGRLNVGNNRLVIEGAARGIYILKREDALPVRIVVR